ncbi:hypothetical protein BASA62_006551 [Batrachochytrium salamandrivorans]|nr:hypothetical protein BASA62_006551 [Batrachochytrium salamandrivorans]
MLAPPIDQFVSRDALIEHVRTFGAANGYGVKIARSKLNKGQVMEMSTAGVRPREILSSLRQSDPSTLATSQTSIVFARESVLKI